MLTRTFLLLSVVASTVAYGQTDTTYSAGRKLKYYNQLSAGGLIGKEGQGTGVTLSMIHGVRINRFAGGVGVAFDGYRNWNVVPVFGSASFDVAKIKQNAFYLQLNVGYSFVKRLSSTETILYDYKEYGSQMINAMVGYRLNAEKYRLYIQAGHKYQVVHFGYHPLPPWSSLWAPRVTVEEELNRFVMAIGFGFN